MTVTAATAAGAGVGFVLHGGSAANPGSPKLSVFSSPAGPEDALPAPVAESVARALGTADGGLPAASVRFAQEADGERYWLLALGDRFCLASQRLAGEGFVSLACSSSEAVSRGLLVSGTPTSRDGMTVVGVAPDGYVSASELAPPGSVAAIAGNTYLLRDASGTIALTRADGSAAEVELGLAAPLSEPSPSRVP